MSHSIDTETPGDAAIYQHPLAYLLGLQGVALFRAFAGEYDREFTEARLAEIRALLDCADQLGKSGTAGPITTAADMTVGPAGTRRTWHPLATR
jgi:hypothetical protein